MAVKQCEHKQGQKIPHEARTMRQLNDLGCPNILKLLNFKISGTESWARYYLELCPYGDLEKLSWTQGQERWVARIVLETLPLRP
jgi:hypothetical protein